MLLSKTPEYVVKLMVWKFQSLFFWMLLSKLTAGDIGKQIGCFNPYFSGCFSLSFVFVFVFSFSLTRVSILIFLDASL